MVTEKDRNKINSNECGVELLPVSVKDRDLFIKTYNSMKARRFAYITDSFPMTETRAESELSLDGSSDRIWFKAVEESGKATAFLHVLLVIKDRRGEVRILSAEENPTYNEIIEAVRMRLLREMGLHKFSIMCPSFNKALSMALIERGAVHEATFREEILHEGTYHDVYQFSFFEEDMTE